MPHETHAGGGVGVALPASAATAHDHLVQFYETEAVLVDTVVEFLLPALRDGDAVIVVATETHRRAFEHALRVEGVDVSFAARNDRYLASDARAQLSLFMVDGMPDVRSFVDAMGRVMDQAAQGGRGIRVYGETVAVLRDEGAADPALALEDMWNDLARTRSFALLCAYPMAAFDDESCAAAFGRVCEQHTAVIPNGRWSPLASPAQRSREVAQLERKAAALHREVLMLRAQQQHDGLPVYRGATGESPDWTGRLRDQASEERDDAGHRRDVAAEERDQAAEAREKAAEERDKAAERSEVLGSRGTIHTDAVRPSAFARREAADDRKRASQDRRAAAGERRQAESDRGTALSDRDASARERDLSYRDDLTDAFRRGAGLAELQREIMAAREAGRPFSLAFVDVDHLKTINDSRGHAAGDRMLFDVVETLRAQLHRRDLIIRYGGDEFLCAFPGRTLAEATRQLEPLNTLLAAGREPGSVTIGIAELLPDESPADLVSRADAALYRERQKQRFTSPS